jgi:Protein of unknown function (DUF3168)
MIVEIELQRALKTALTTAGLTVYDFAPQAADGASTASFPYVEIGHIIASEWDTDTETGFDVICRVHTYSRTSSTLECRTVQGAIYAALHRAELAVTGFLPILINREMSDCTRQPDGSFHGVCEYRTLIATS